MREILFKAKRVDNGEWCYGVPLVEGWSKTTYIASYEYSSLAFVQQIEVIPETLGQFTGLTDKNGKRIWENDIVITQPFYDRPYSDKRKSKRFLGIVEYQTGTFNGNKFYPKQVYQAKWGLNYTEEHGKFVHFSWGDLWGCEVIGNRFDNPELLTAERSE